MVNNSELRKNGKNVEIHVDSISGQKFEIDWGRKLITNVTFADEKAIDIKKHIIHRYKYKLKGQARTMADRDLLIFLIKDLKTGRRRVTLKDEVTNMVYPLSMPNAIELGKILLSCASDDVEEEKKEKDKIEITDKDKWLFKVLNERYATGLIGMILENPSYGITVKEVKERFNFPNEQKARNVLFKFKKLGFLVAQRTTTKESFYMPSIERDRLIRFIKRFYGIGDD